MKAKNIQVMTLIGQAPTSLPQKVAHAALGQCFEVWGQEYSERNILWFTEVEIVHDNPSADPENPTPLDHWRQIRWRIAMESEGNDTEPLEIGFNAFPDESNEEGYRFVRFH